MRRAQPIAILPLFLGLALVASQTLATDFTGRVVGVPDGEAITELRQRHPEATTLEAYKGNANRSQQVTPQWLSNSWIVS